MPSIQIGLVLDHDTTVALSELMRAMGAKDVNEFIIAAIPMLQTVMQKQGEIRRRTGEPGTEYPVIRTHLKNGFVGEIKRISSQNRRRRGDAYP